MRNGWQTEIEITKVMTAGGAIPIRDCHQLTIRILDAFHPLYYCFPGSLLGYSVFPLCWRSHLLILHFCGEYAPHDRQLWVVGNV